MQLLSDPIERDEDFQAWNATVCQIMDRSLAHYA
eukprot:CAMPEP_0177255174 /NCGR_PEP_ID=MMETSP0367-20130122/56198_1 /TAXON_ID=447022 ORGANISM="Scrippsiella hangoei-like, Strain SHHI-4" /NCGR_SAMPLE_ID=MMETSP0367 /ASSEMBLY_ACC=CAM_ASM_000362 /LENGTH=33 /DNA_ID= /DNA_START= /DNA_END= /DNA_ORIENTATION=